MRPKHRRQKSRTQLLDFIHRSEHWWPIVDIEGLPSRHAVLFDWENGAEPSEAELLGPFEVLGAVTARITALRYCANEG